MTDPVVELQSGLIRGVVVKHEDNFDYYAFKNIPYAEPPVGELRFKDPVPKKPWTGVMECKEYGAICLQCDLFTGNKSYDEDCLYLNIFTRSINDSYPLKPVLVVIHGGAFLCGSGTDLLYGPEYLIRKELVMVTFNYRLGVLGFLNLDDEVAPGNQGIKDQIMVLQWVQQNIRSFNGDPDNVTVLGMSAGSGSSQLLALSPQTKGMIHKLMSFGGTLYNPWMDFSNGKSNAIKLCSILGQQLTDPKEIVKFLRTIDPKQLQEAQERLREMVDELPFGPSVDSKSPNPCMPLHRYKAMEDGIHIPCLVGGTQREGLLILAEKLSKNWVDLWNMDFENALVYNAQEIMNRYGLTVAQIKRMYFKSEVISMDDLDQYVDYSSDIYFLEGIHKFAKVQAEKSSASTYLYNFSYDHPRSLSKMLFKISAPGACHLDDLPYLFKCRGFNVAGIEHFKKGTRQYKMMEQMTELCSNFVRYGRPTIEKTELIPVHWKPLVNGTCLRYLNVDVNISMKLAVNVDQKFLSAKNIRI